MPGKKVGVVYRHTEIAIFLVGKFALCILFAGSLINIIILWLPINWFERNF